MRAEGAAPAGGLLAHGRRRLASLLGGPRVAVVHRFQPPPYGGGNQFLLALMRELDRQGVETGRNRIGARTRAVLFNSYNFDDAWVGRLESAAVRRVHRVDGPIGAYRGTDAALDRRIVEMNAACADATVLQSRYSLEAHRALGLELREPVVILNSVDPEIFHPRGRAIWDGRRPLRLVASSWSDNPRKGTPTLQWLESRLDPSRFEITFVGRSPVPFQRARSLAPLASAPLAALLREQDVYLALSHDDPCSNALLEGLACGLPALYRRSGGHPELVGEAGLGFSDDAEIPDLLSRLASEYGQRQRAIAVPRLEDVAVAYRQVLGV